jgi:hypothetical protein
VSNSRSAETPGKLKGFTSATCPPTVPSGSEPQLNLIEGIWRKLKGFLLPRRCYDNLAQLREALRVGLKALNAVTV